MFRNLKRYLLIIFVVGIAIAPVSTIFAKPPEEFEGKLVYEDAVFWSCPGFDIIENAVVIWHGEVFFDEEGNPLFERGHLRYIGTLTNSVTGKTVSDMPDPQNWLFDFTTGLGTIRGLQWKLIVPGEGSVVVDAGTITFDPVTGELLVVHGPHQMEQEGLAVLCAVLE